MKKNLLNKLLAGMLAVSLALPSAMVMPGMETVVQAAGGLSVTGVIGTNIDGVSYPELDPNPQFGWYLVPGTEDVRLLFEINSDKKSVSLTHNSVYYNWIYHYEEVKDIPLPTDLSFEIPAYVDGYPVTKIGSGDIDTTLYRDYALNYLNLTSVTIPNTVTTLADYLFNYTVLEEITLSDSVTDIGESCFGSTKIKSVVVPKNLKKIKMGTFADCKDLVDVSLPEGLVEIGDCAFDHCTSLENIIIPSSVKKIGSDVFVRCYSLKSITIPDEVTAIRERTFCDCTSLESITIPASVTKIETDAFTNTPALKAVSYKGTPDQWKKIDMTGGVKTALKTATVTCSDGSKIVGGKVQEPSPSQDDEKPGDENGGKPEDKDKDKDKDDDKDKNDGENKQAAVKSVTLSADKYTYNGKAKKPSVTAIDSNGKKISSKYYTVSYKNNKNVGQATVTVKFKGNYSGTVKKTFIIKPARTAISRVTGKSKGMTLKWKKNTKQVSGYQIQYSTTSKFKKGTTASVYVKKASTTTRTIKKLTGKKKYYVRIRTYKTAKVNGKSIKVFSSWSPVKQVVTKK